MSNRNWTIFAMFLGMFSATVAMAQGKPARLTFDVASIRLHDPKMPSRDVRGIRPIPGGHGYTAVNITVKLMMSVIYKLPERQIKGGPDWIDRDCYDVEARVDGTYSLDDLHTMYQSLLEDRFGLKFHKEEKDGPKFVLTVEPTGVKMKANDTAQNQGTPMTPNGTGDITATRTSMPYFAWFLGQLLLQEGRPVVDHTGLTGFFDFRLRYQPPLPPGVSVESFPPEVQERPRLIEAMRDQLGLRLKPQNGPVEYFMIDNLNRPSPD